VNLLGCGTLVSADVGYQVGKLQPSQVKKTKGLITAPALIRHRFKKLEYGTYKYRRTWIKRKVQVMYCTELQ
jgi:hypothetical protein